MKQAEKMRKIREVLELGKRPVVTMAEIAQSAGLGYRQVQRALSIHFRQENARTPTSHEFGVVGNHRGTWIYSKARCDNQVIPF